MNYRKVLLHAMMFIWKLVSSSMNIQGEKSRNHMGGSFPYLHFPEARTMRHSQQAGKSWMKIASFSRPLQSYTFGCGYSPTHKNAMKSWEKSFLFSSTQLAGRKKAADQSRMVLLQGEGVRQNWCSILNRESYLSSHIPEYFAVIHKHFCF